MTTPPAVFDRLSTLGDTTRSRLLGVLEEGEHTVTELCRILQAPQSTVSGHLRVLSDAGWVGHRSEGKRRLYRMARSLDPEARALWELVRADMESAGFRATDRERARAVRAARVDRAREYFSRTAGRWDEVRTELYGGRTELLPLHALLDPTWIVADLGCGSGALAAALAPFVHRVEAVDRSPEMLEAARTRIREELPSARGTVRLHEAELEALPLEDGSVDLAVLNLVLHFVPDPAAALAEAVRILRPGGRLVAVEMRSHDRAGYRETMGHLWPGFAPERLEGWLDGAGLETVRVNPLPPDPAAQGPLLHLATGRRPIDTLHHDPSSSTPSGRTT